MKTSKPSAPRATLRTKQPPPATARGARRKGANTRGSATSVGATGRKTILKARDRELDEARARALSAEARARDLEARLATAEARLASTVTRRLARGLTGLGAAARRALTATRLAVTSPRRYRWVREIRRSGLFDVDGYRRQVPGLGRSGLDPIVHFVCHGVDEGRNPHPLFDTDGYRHRYVDVAANGGNPLVHFLRRGSSEQRCPHPLFDSRFYLEQLPVSISEDPLSHYLREGAAARFDPHPLFSSRYYLETNGDVVATGLNPLVHYTRAGG